MAKNKRKNSNYKDALATKNITPYIRAKTPLYSAQNVKDLYTHANESPRIALQYNVAYLCYKYPGLTIATLDTANPLLFHAYQEELIKNFHRMSDEELLSYDCIDTSDVDLETKCAILENLRKQSADAQYVYHTPCFSTGIIRENDNTICQYEMWDNKDVLCTDMPIPLNERWTVLDISIYTKAQKIKPEQQRHKYELIAQTSTYMQTNGPHFDITTYNGNWTTQSEIMQMIPVEELPWTQMDKDIWRYYAIPIAAITADHNKDDTKTICAIAMADGCCNQFAIANTLIEQHKNRMPTPHGKVIQTAVAASNDDPSDQLIVRHFGKLRTRSYEPPDCIQERVVHYKKPKWPVRSYTRPLTSGKVITIDPSERHRRKVDLSHIDASATATTLKFHSKSEGTMQ